jgi:hypothetical protein
MGSTLVVRFVTLIPYFFGSCCSTNFGCGRAQAVQIRHQLQTQGHVNSLMASPAYTTRRHTSQVRPGQTPEVDDTPRPQPDVEVLQIDARDFTEDPNEIRTIERFLRFANVKLREDRFELVASRLAEQPADPAVAAVSLYHRQVTRANHGARFRRIS